MKKIKLLVASVVMTTMLSTTAFAALPGNAIIIGDKAYDIGYISKNVRQLNDILNNSSQYTNIYYNDLANNKIVNLFDTTKAVDMNTFKPTNITYYNVDGTRTNYNLVGTEFQTDSNSSTVYAEVTVNSVGSTMYFVSIRVPNNTTIGKVDVRPYTLEPKYFKVYNNNNSDLIKKIGTPDALKGESNDEYLLNLVTTDLNMKLQILSSDKTLIATVTPTAAIGVGKSNVKFKIDNSFIPPTSNVSNTNGLGNLNNNGLANQSGDWTYYSNSGDGGGIYKTNGIQSYKICEDNAKFINVVGDWLYYSNYSDGQKIYKIKTDGTGRRIVCTDQASYVVVSGEYIYYSYHSGTGVGNIRKVNRDANKSPGTNITNDEAEYLIVAGDMIYFTNKYQGNGIYSVHTDGTYRTRVSNDSARFITLANDKIYYVTDSGQLKWTLKNGGSSGSTVVSNGSTGSNAVIYSMNIADDGKWMYYADASDGNKVYRAPLVDYLRIPGDKYSNDYANFINLVGDKVYYTKGNAMFVANQPKISPNKDSNGRAIYEYSSTAVAKPKQDLKIVSYDKVATPTKNAVGADLNNLEEYLPDKVTAVMSDNSVRELLVDWDLNPKKGAGTSASKIQYTGTIVGYGAKVTLSLSMASEPIPAKSVKVINNAGLLDDKIYVNKDESGAEMPIKASLQVGDTIKVYRDANKAELLGQDIIVPSVSGNLLSTTITLRKEKTLTDDAKYVYVTRTSPGVLESEPVQVEITEALSGKPTFNPGVGNIVVTNYGILPNGLTESDIVEVKATTELKQGDIVNVYKLVDNVRVRVASQMVEYEPNSDPFAPVKYKATISIPAGYIEYKAGGDNKIYVTRSTQFAESDAVEATFGEGIALPLGQLVISGTTAGGVLLRNQLDSQFEYYYKINGATPALGEDIVTDASKGWTKIADLNNAVISGVTNGQDVYVVQVYNKQALKCSHAKASVQ